MIRKESADSRLGRDSTGSRQGTASIEIEKWVSSEAVSLTKMPPATDFICSKVITDRAVPTNYGIFIILV